MDTLAALSDDALIDRLERGAFSYFAEYTNAENGLVADTSRDQSPCSIAVVGFALSCYPVAVERGWMSREAAAAQTLKTLRFFWSASQSDQPDATGYKGFFYHFLDMKTGRRVWQCELSLIDTTLLIAGMLTAGGYFDGGGDEPELRALADALYRRIDWHWAQNDTEIAAQGWKPECGFLHYGWDGYNEATILYILGLGSPTHPLLADSFGRWTSTYQWENMLGKDVLYSGPLFTHLFSHAWIDFRGIQDKFMREKRSDYFENTRNTVAVHREYAARNPRGYEGYGRDFWGITAGDGPVHQDLRENGRDTRFFGYMSRGVPCGPDDGTVAPWAMLATLPFTPEAALAGARHLLDAYPQVCTKDRFSSGFNPTLDDGSRGWLSEGWYGLDQGLLVMMIENARTGLIWKILRDCPYLRIGLKRAGFGGGWLSP
ncbi:MAG TPA: glucoamylase family protein [Stellaceae bacterium]|nr:glucoamylase family protein [Stellaceae bacterium]